MKPGRLTAIIKGAIASIGAMALYAISLGCFTALMLLVISMEEGGENLPSSAIRLTQSIILLSQGTGFVIGSVDLTITPLLLTLLLILLIAQCVRKAGGDLISWAVGLVIWVAINLMCAGGVPELIGGSPLAIIGKTASVWTVGFLIGALPGSGVIAAVRVAVRERVNRRFYDSVLLALLLTGTMIAVALVAGLVVVIVWIARDWQGMATLFDMDGMENGSRILTTVASCAWLPNLMIWAVSWLLGAGFHIGELGSFTLWVGQAAGLPPLPVFGLMPEGVADDRVRLGLQCIVPAIYAVIALLAMLLPGPLKVRPAAFGDKDGVKSLIVTMLCHLGAFVGSTVVTLALYAGGFALSNGGLGTQRLAHVGVDVLPSLQVTARALGFGLFAAWLAVTVVLAAIYGIHWIVEYRAGRRPSSPADGTKVKSETKDSGKTRVMSLRSKEPDSRPKPRSAAGSTGRGKDSDLPAGPAGPDKPSSDAPDGERRPRTVRGVEGKGGRVPRSVRVVRSAGEPVKPEQPSKEENNDNNQPSD
nr:DUF6350 family protein [Bifidobacterium santillanense]